MAMLLRVFLSVLAVACVPAVRTEVEGHGHLDSKGNQDGQSAQETDIHEHVSQEAGGKEEEGKKACCRCKSRGHMYVDNSGHCSRDCPVFQYGDCP